MLRITQTSSRLLARTSPLGIRLNSTKPAPENDPLSILSSISKPVQNRSNDNSKRSFLGESSLSLTSKYNEPSALDVASKLPLFAKHAGRTVMVKKGSLNRSLYQFETMVRTNDIKNIFFEQRFYTKPNKVRLNKRIANKKKRFDAGIAKLFEVVRDAVRKGY